MAARKSEFVTDKEAARELFIAGYHQALDDVAEFLGLTPRERETSFIGKLRAKAAMVKARATIAKATGGNHAH